eukprot:scaffold4850_cov213-Pinguiococcus_pyrenoidosus.AAC.11
MKAKIQRLRSTCRFREVRADALGKAFATSDMRLSVVLAWLASTSSPQAGQFEIGGRSIHGPLVLWYRRAAREARVASYADNPEAAAIHC